MVEYLKINGEDYPVRIGYFVMKQVKKETGKSFGQALREVEDTGDVEVHETILFNALKMGNYAENGELDAPFDKEEMPMVLDMCFSDYLELFQSETFFPKKMREMAQEGLEEAENKGAKKQKPTRKKKAKQT